MNELLKTILPWIGAAATGNVPQLVGMAATAIGQAIGVEVEPNQRAIQQAVASATPEQLTALRQADNDFALKMQSLGFANLEELERVAAGDRKDARARDVSLHLAGYRNQRADLMVLTDVIGLLFGLLGMLALGYVKAKYPDAISEGVFGALLAQLSTVTSYFGLSLRDAHQFEFGSSRGSRDKDELLAKAPSIGQ